MTGATQIKLAGNKFQNVTSPVVDAATSSVHGGYSSYGNTTNTNVITVNSGAYTNVRAGYTDAVKGGSDKNELTFTGTASATNLYGGYSMGTSASAADLKADVAAKADAKGNKVNISGGTVASAPGTGGTVYGGYISSATSAGGATGNSVTITGGSMGDVYGGFTTGTGKTTGNTVNLGDGTNAMASGTSITGTLAGGNGADTTGNTLNVKTNAAAANIKNFENLAFYVNSSALNAANPMLTLNSATNNLDWRKLTVDASKFNGTISTFEPYNLVLMRNAAGISFMKGADDTYTLGGGVKSTTSGDFEFTIDTSSHTASATQVTAAGYKFKNHVASYSETTAHNEAWAGRTAAGNKVEKNKLTVTAGNITAAAYGGLVINNKPNATTGDAENNMIAVSGGNVQAAYGAKLLTKGGSATTNTAVITGGTVHDVYGASLAAAGATGTVTKGYHLSLGWTRELKKKHATLTFTPFVEYGKGKYDSFLDDGTHGSGHVSYLGAGIMGRLEKTNGVWAEAALHGGKARSDYSGSIYSGTNSHYDSSNAYYAAHLGIGKEFRVNAKDRLDTYLRYFWSRQSGMQADIATSGRGAGVDTYDFGVVNSNRVRMGFRYTHKDSEKSEILAGLAWEYELSGKAGVSFQGYDAPSPSLRGGSLMLELAYRFAPKNSRFSYNVHMTGWQGTHRGVTGGAQVNWAF